MTNTGKKMVFDLKVQSSDKPGNNFIMCSAICCRFHLVNGPFCFYYLEVVRYHVKFSMLDHMRQLKNDGERKSKHTMEGDEGDSPRFPPNYKRRKQNVKSHVQNLTHPKNEVIFPVHILNRGPYNFLRKIFYKIHDECPCNRCNGIYEGEINMLYAMS